MSLLNDLPAVQPVPNPVSRRAHPEWSGSSFTISAAALPCFWLSSISLWACLSPTPTPSPGGSGTATSLSYWLFSLWRNIWKDFGGIVRPIATKMTELLRWAAKAVWDKTRNWFPWRWGPRKGACLWLYAQMVRSLQYMWKECDLMFRLVIIIFTKVRDIYILLCIHFHMPWDYLFRSDVVACSFFLINFDACHVLFSVHFN